MAASHLAYKAANISDSLLSKISAMGATYPFVTLTITDGGDLCRLTSFSGPPDIEHLLTKKYTYRRRPLRSSSIGYTYGNDSKEFDAFTDLQADPSKINSRLIGVRVWSHKYIHGIQLVYRRPKVVPKVPLTAEDLWKKLDNQKNDEKLIQEKADENIEKAEEEKQDEIPDKQKDEVDDRFWESTIFGSGDNENNTTTLHEFHLGDNEYLTNMEINYSAVIMGITLHSSSGRKLSIGTQGGSYHKFSAFPSSAIVALHGHFGPHNNSPSIHVHDIGVVTQEIHPEIEGDCEVLRLLGNYTYRLKEVIPMSENKRFYIFKFQDLDDRAIQRKECLI